MKNDKKIVNLKGVGEVEVVPNQEFMHYQIQPIGNGNFVLVGSNDKKSSVIVHKWNENDSDSLEQLMSARSKVLNSKKVVNRLLLPWVT